MAIITWLHLSDWHQGGGDFDRTVVARALLDDIENRATISPELAEIDFLFFTGDLAFRGKKEEYEAARNLLLEPVLEKLALKSERLFLIPGNHDLDRDKFKLLPAGLLQPFQTRQEANDWLTGEEERAEVLKPFGAYQKFATEFGPLGFGAYGDSRIVSLKGKQIGVVGFNSALMCGRPDASGKINDYGFLTTGEPQILDPLRNIVKADVRIALIHHPFDWLTEEDREIVETRMQQGCDFILRGHVHRQGVKKLVSTEGDCVIVPGGACYNGRIPERPQYINAYNFVRYNTETGQGTVYLRRWNLNDTGWTADTDRGDREGQYHFGFPRAAQITVSTGNTHTATVSALPISDVPFERNSFIAALEKMTTTQLSQIIQQVPGAESQIAESGAVTERVVQLVRYAESPVGPTGGLEKVYHIVKERFPNFHF